jgi:hypothetical protein
MYDCGVGPLSNVTGVVAFLAQEKNYRLAFSSVEMKCRTF